MASRIVLYGATGYTGALTARALAAGGVRLVLAGRDQGRLSALADRLAQAGDGTEPSSRSKPPAPRPDSGAGGPANSPSPRTVGLRQLGVRGPTRTLRT
jgi:uncharacterized protein YbjT (DUF2867 family)